MKCDVARNYYHNNRHKMLKTRKFLTRYVYTLLILCVVCLVLIHLFSEPSEFRDSKYKIGVIEQAIQSDDNHGLCQIPDPPIDNPEIMKFYEATPEINCGNEDDDWVFCEKSVCKIKNEIVKKNGPVVCAFTDLIRKSDFKVRYGKTTRTESSYTLKESDFAKVICKAENDERWFGYVIGIRESLERKITKHNSPPLNVLMYGFDSLSKNAFIRKLPKTYDYLVNVLSSHVLQGYNIVGDGTPQALIPILTGQTELELPETRKRIKNSNFVNVYPMIWNDYQKNGYVTSFNEDVPNIGTFSYRLNGFDKQPTDHYMRTFYLEIENYLSSFGQFCIGHTTSHRVMLDYTFNFMLKYVNTPKFVFSFHGELSHDSINLIGAADNDIKNFLERIDENGILNNTILIIMSDHGNRFAEVRNTLQGKQEERLPFFSFTFPQWFRNKYPVNYKNFVENTKKLTTPFDIHETLYDILRIQGLEDSPVAQDTESRALSLFRPIPKSRSCADAYIEPHWCACLNWKQLNDSKTAQEVASALINKINDYTSAFRNICEELQVNEINWLMKLTPNENLLKFKQNRDLDGFLADLSSQTKININMYQIKITTSPGFAIFEASVTHFINQNKFVVRISDISRVNKYGSQANCIYETQPQLRKYCFCK